MGLPGSWDPFFQAHSSNQVGNLCLYAPEEPEVCHECYGNGSFPPPQAAAGVPTAHFARRWRAFGSQGMERSWNVRKLMRAHAFVEGRRILEKDDDGRPTSSYACTECFFAAHYFRHILDLVGNASRPLCQPARLRVR